MASNLSISGGFLLLGKKTKHLGQSRRGFSHLEGLLKDFIQGKSSILCKQLYRRDENRTIQWKWSGHVVK